MAKSTQSKNGKAFEFACVKAISEKASGEGIKVDVSSDKALTTAEDNYNGLAQSVREHYDSGATSAVGFIFDCEPHIWDTNIATKLTLILQDDAKGQVGDVRDLLILRFVSKEPNKSWEIGVSCKHNHDAIKHPRVSIESDFLENWTNGDFTVSDDFFPSIDSVSQRILDDFKKGKDERSAWSDLFKNRDVLYKTIRDAVAEEIRKKQSNPCFVRKLFDFLLGTKDFYKVIARDDEELTTVSVFNFNGTLNRPTREQKPRRKLQATKRPKELLSVSTQGASYITLSFDQGWSIVMRLHTASSKVEKSLKFDAKLEGIPITLLNTSFLWGNQN